MLHMRGFGGKSMRPFAISATLFAAIGLCLAPCLAEAAGKYDGSAPFVCVPTAVAECSANGLPAGYCRERKSSRLFQDRSQGQEHPRRGSR